MIANDLKDLFDDLLADVTGLDEHSTITKEQLQQKLATGIVDIICDALDGGTITPTVYSGTCSLGTVTATVFGSNPVLNYMPGKAAAVSSILSAFSSMSSDHDWNNAVCNATANLINASTITDNPITGTAIPPVVPPPTVPVVGSAMGTLSCLAPVPTLVLAVDTVCATLSSAPNPNGALLYAQALGTALTTILNANTCTMNGNQPQVIGLTAITMVTGVV